MTKILKKIIFIILLVISINLFPNKVDALTTEYKKINEDILSLNDDNSSFQFTKVSFRNSSESSNSSFGLVGTVYNGNNYDVLVITTVIYYDSNYNIIATTYADQIVPAGQYNSYSQISNLNVIKSGYTVDDIAYYKIEAEINRRKTTSNDTAITDNSNTTPSKNNSYKSHEYVIDKYDINIIVNENNTFDITETITAYFNVSKHGIFRTIPLRNTITRLDGTTSKNRVQISNLSVNHEYKTSRENGNYKIKIGSADHTLTGEHTYVIKYTYNIGKDPVKEYDELYYNIIGNDWDTAIGNITFNITMPKEFDSSKFGFSSGTLGSTNNSNVKYTVNGNKISGSYNGILGAGEALTIRGELPKGYFIGAGFTTNFIDYIMFIIPILFLGISIFWWYKFGRDDKVVETVEFYPPEGFNSLEVGFLYKGEAENQDVVSLLIYLANKGYIKIAEIEEKGLFSMTKGFKITKLKEYDGNNINEQVFLDGLFKKKTKTKSVNENSQVSNDNTMDEVTSSDLYNSFYRTMEKILSNINNKKNKNKVFEKTASGKSGIIIFMIIVTYCLITLLPLFAYYGYPDALFALLFALMFPGIGFTIMIVMLFEKKQPIYINGKITYSSVFAKLFGLVFGFIYGGIPWTLIVLPTLSYDLIYFTIYIVGVVCILGMTICLKYLPKRTPYGNEMLGKLRGFRNFLETAERDRLEAMVIENPSYFYDILPYTYVLGVSDKWIKKFETISLQEPSWYDSSTAFDMATFGSFMNNTLSSAQNTMSSSPSSGSSSSGSSGGGFSGGGSGGGGGGSW